MLVQFGVKNYRSIKDRAALSLLAGTDKEHFDDLINLDGKKWLVPAAAIYGANSSGKSNILMAIRTMQDMIIGSSAQLLKEKRLPYDPFMFTEPTQSLPTEFEVIFYYRDVKYAYGFSYDSKQILSEELYHWPNGREALIFSREKDKYEFRENINEQSVLAGRTPGNKLYLVSSNEWNAPQTELAYKWFIEKLIPYDEQDSPGRTIAAIGDISGNPIRERILRELLLADLGIADVGVNTDPSASNKQQVFVVHKTENENGTAKFPIPLERESKGTQRFFARIGPWIHALEEGGVLFIDEIEASLHPMLTRRLVEMIQNPETNISRAQLVFTTHDAMLLDLSLLRRDQIWFTEKAPQTLTTELFSLWDFSVRKGENIRNGYLQGRYGAIPFLAGAV